MTNRTDSKTPVVRQMLRRGAVLAAVFGVGALALLLARLYHIQITDHAFYEDLAISQQLREAPGTEVILYFDADISPDIEKLPELTGMSLRDARDTLSYYGLYLNALSPLTDPEKQTVSSQSVPAGTALPHGSVVEVTLIDSDEAFLGRY